MSQATPGNSILEISDSKLFQGHEAQISSIAFTPDCRFAISGSYDDTARLWDLEEGREIYCFKGHSNWIKSVDISRDGARALTASIDGTARLWDCKTGQVLYTYSGQTASSMQAAAFSPDGLTGLFGNEDGSVRLWDLETKKEIHCLGEHMTGVICSRFSPNGRLALAGIGKTIHLWDMNTYSEVYSLDNKGRLKSVAFSGDGRLIISGSDDGAVRIWDLETGEEIHLLRAYNRWFHGVGISLDGKTALSGYDEWTDGKNKLIIRLWNLESKETRDLVFIGHSMSISCVAFLPDGKRILSGGADNKLRLWLMPS